MRQQRAGVHESGDISLVSGRGSPGLSGRADPFIREGCATISQRFNVGSDVKTASAPKERLSESALESAGPSGQCGARPSPVGASAAPAGGDKFVSRLTSLHAAAIGDSGAPIRGWTA